MTANRLAAARLGIMGTTRDFFESVAEAAWMKQGRCADPDENPEDWFPLHSNGISTDRALRHAIEVCGACPVRLPCLDYAMTHHGIPRRLSGVWGGTTEGQRRRALNDEGAA